MPSHQTFDTATILRACPEASKPRLSQVWNGVQKTCRLSVESNAMPHLFMAISGFYWLWLPPGALITGQTSVNRANEVAMTETGRGIPLG